MVEEAPGVNEYFNPDKKVGLMFRNSDYSGLENVIDLDVVENDHKYLR